MSPLHNRYCSHRALPCTAIVYFNGTNHASLSVLSTYGARQLNNGAEEHSVLLRCILKAMYK